MTYILAVLAGLLVGTLINYLSDVLPANRKLVRPTCPNCGHAYSFGDYLLLHRCKVCGQGRFSRGLIVLLGSILVTVLLVEFPMPHLNFWATLPLLVFMGVIAVIDIEHHIVLFEISMAGLLLCFAYGLILWDIKGTLLGGLAGFAIMGLFYLMGLAFTRVAGRIRHKPVSEVAFGFGDVFAGTFLGFLNGWPLMLKGLIIALIAFVVFSLGYYLVLLLTGKYRAFSHALPFTPFLILGAAAAFYL